MKLASLTTNSTVRDLHLQLDPIGLFMLFLCLFTIVGNLLIILAIIRDQTLHTSKYYYIGSLALADFLVGLIVMPLAFIFEMTDDEYVLFPQHLQKVCDFWHSIDIFASTASILGLSIIGIDRYVAITKPMEYSNSFICKYWLYNLLFIWIFSAVISFPAVIHLGTDKQSPDKDPLGLPYRECEFPDNPYYLLFTWISTFFIPLIIMIYVYVKVYTAAKRQAAALRSGYKHQSIAKSSRSFFSACCSKERAERSTTNGVSSPPPESITLRIHCGQYQNPHLQEPNDEPRPRRKKSLWRTISQDQKAGTFVGLVMGVFVVCWLPYFTYFLLGVFDLRVKNKQQDELLFRIFSWLGYVNSALDVLVYIFTSKELRTKFSKLCSRSNSAND